MTDDLKYAVAVQANSFLLLHDSIKKEYQAVEKLIVSQMSGKILWQVHEMLLQGWENQGYSQDESDETLETVFKRIVGVY